VAVRLAFGLLFAMGYGLLVYDLLRIGKRREYPKGERREASATM